MKRTNLHQRSEPHVDVCIYSSLAAVAAYLFQVALAPALFCFSPLSSGELFSLFPSSLRLGELINLSRCRVLMVGDMDRYRDTLSTGQQRKRVRRRADVERSKTRTELEGRRDIRDRRACEGECTKCGSQQRRGEIGQNDAERDRESVTIAERAGPRQEAGLHVAP